MEAFVLVMLAICFIGSLVVSVVSIKEVILSEDPMEKMLCGLCSALFTFMLLAITFIAYEFNNYIGGIL